jgi:hypothetical protein
MATVAFFARHSLIPGRPRDVAIPIELPDFPILGKLPWHASGRISRRPDDPSTSWCSTTEAGEAGVRYQKRQRGHATRRNPLNILAPRPLLEPGTYGLTGGEILFPGASTGTRTCLDIGSFQYSRGNEKGLAPLQGLDFTTIFGSPTWARTRDLRINRRSVGSGCRPRQGSLSGVRTSNTFASVSSISTGLERRIDYWILESFPPRMPGCSAVLFLDLGMAAGRCPARQTTFAYARVRPFADLRSFCRKRSHS